MEDWETELLFALDEELLLRLDGTLLLITDTLVAFELDGATDKALLLATADVEPPPPPPQACKPNKTLNKKATKDIVLKLLCMLILSVVDL